MNSINFLNIYNEFKEISLLENYLFDESILNKFSLHFSMILQWNKTHNLTRITTVSDSFYYHYLDSIRAFQEFSKQFDRKYNILDIGSGAGFPSVPLAILYPNFRFYLSEKSKKRRSFLHMLRSKLNLDNVEILMKEFPYFPSDINAFISRATPNFDTNNTLMKLIRNNLQNKS
jgi:16S rRNA (guanine527-N7)-methyltransferase